MDVVSCDKITTLEKDKVVSQIRLCSVTIYYHVNKKMEVQSRISFTNHANF